MKAHVLNSTKLDGSVTFVIAALSNALTPIFVMLSGILSDVNAESANALLPISFTPYCWYSDDEYDYDYEDGNDDYYEERDSYGNITFVRTNYYSEKYEYTYYADGSIKTMACYEEESF